MKILILRFSSIGDIVLTTPVIRCLKHKYPEAEIHYATKKAFHPILEHNPYVSKVHLLQHSLMELVKVLKKEKFDYVIDLHHNQRTWLVKLLLGVKSFSFDKINWQKWLMVNFKINRLPQKHIVDRYLESCRALSVENDQAGLDYFISKEDDNILQSLPAPFQSGYIGWVIGAKHYTKKYPTDKIVAALCAERFPDYPVILLGGKEDAAEAESIIETAVKQKPTLKIYNACGKYPLNQSAALVKHSKLIVTNDTGLMHIAAAFKKTMVTIWGNTIRNFGMGPYGATTLFKETGFEVEGLSCRPCSKLGYDKCPQGHFNCMRLHDDTQLAIAISMYLRIEMPR